MSRMTDRASEVTAAFSSRSEPAARVADGGLRQERRDAVEPLELLVAVLSLMASSARTRARSSRSSSATAWNFVRVVERDPTAPQWRLDLADGAGEHRDDVVAVTALSSFAEQCGEPW